MLTTNDFRYRADIDGLRAIAVLSIVLYHADLRCSGGYVGVDVFFVISGFLITSLIWKDLEKGRFTFANFWERRARRIVPPLVLVTIAVLIIGYFFLLPSDLFSLGKAAAAQSIFGANIYYWLDSGYFSNEVNEKPLLHTWSLAVEEQFYLIAPFLFWKMFRLVQTRRMLISMLAAGFILSFAGSIYGVSHSPSATFYLLPTRTWELLMGSIIVFLPDVKLRTNIRELLAISGITLIFVSIFFYSNQTPFPGLAALLPCLGAALLIYANAKPTVIGSILSKRPMVFIGLISYSLYLWHWPLLAFSRYLSLEPLSLIERIAVIAAGFLFAGISWKYIEMPFRKRKIAASRKLIFTYNGLGMTIILICGLIFIQSQGVPQRFPAETIEFASSVSDKDFIHDLTVDDINSDTLTQIGVADKSPTVLVWGDSHAMAVDPAFDVFLKEKGLSGKSATHSTTPPVIGWYQPSLKIKIPDIATNTIVSLDENSINFNNAVLAYIKSHHIKEVVLTAAWIYYAEANGFKSALLTTIRQIIEAGARPWILLDVPIPSFNVPKALSRSNYSLATLNSFYASLNEFDAQFVDDMKSAGAGILDPKPLFKDSEGLYIIQLQGIALYRDSNHLTATGAKLILLPFLRSSFTIGNE